jgi:16S rRNA (uracil1498-N3)-methyltransferase
MHRFYLSQEVVNGGLILSEGDQLHHLKNVLRLKAGEEVEVFDGQGHEYLCQIRSVEQKQAFLQVKSPRAVALPKFKLAMGCAIPKQVKMDEIVDKLTQLGVDIIIPLITARVVGKRKENSDVRLKRWRKIALSAAEQSQRSRIPEVMDIMSLAAFLHFARDYKIKLIPTLAGSRTNLSETLNSSEKNSIAVLIGPEGDFSADEIGLALAAGFVPVSLGDLVLRVDTAAIATASYIRLSLLQ